MDIEIEVGQRWRQKVAPVFEVTLIEVCLDRIQYRHEPTGRAYDVLLTDLVEFWERVDVDG